MSVPAAVARFRARFHGVGAADRADETMEASIDARLTECLELHGLALWMDIERVMRETGARTPEDAVDEANRRRLAASPMPPSLRSLAAQARR
jgi:hypothetical protein